MSVLSGWYGEVRDAGSGHRRALEVLARRVGVDEQSILRTLRRAAVPHPLLPPAKRRRAR